MTYNALTRDNIPLSRPINSRFETTAEGRRLDRYTRHDRKYDINIALKFRFPGYSAVPATIIGGEKSGSIDDKVSLPPEVINYVEQSLSESTCRAYRFDLAHFEDWGGKSRALIL